MHICSKFPTNFIRFFFEILLKRLCTAPYSIHRDYWFSAYEYIKAGESYRFVLYDCLLLALVNATRISLADPAAMRALTHLPLSLIPTFVMPLLLVTHVILFSRTART